MFEGDNLKLKKVGSKEIAYKRAKRFYLLPRGDLSHICMGHTLINWLGFMIWIRPAPPK